MVTAEQIKAARALLRLEQDELARRSGVSVSTIRRLEGAGGALRVADETAAAVLTVLEEAGVQFIHDGVILKKAPAADAEAVFQRLLALAERSARLQAGRSETDADLYDEAGLPK